MILSRTRSRLSRTLETRSLLLRRYRATDLEALYAIQSDPAAMQFTFCAKSLAQSENRLRTYASQYATHGFAPWTVVHKHEGNIIGWGGLNVDPQDYRWGVEIAYFFHPAV